jgi:hypothetical protein
MQLKAKVNRIKRKELSLMSRWRDGDDLITCFISGHFKLNQLAEGRLEFLFRHT